MGEVLAERDPADNRPVVIMTQDEGRFARISDARRCWAPKGIRPKTPRQIVRAFVYVYAAVCMALGRMTSLILPYANTDMMNLFLKEVSKDFKDYFVLMLVDGVITAVIILFLSNGFTRSPSWPIHYPNSVQFGLR